MNKKVVVIGGGHGQATICRGIKNIPNIDITAIVTVADDGGSTGRLRRQFHIPAMGDIRNVMVALAESETLMSSLMNYRFDDPSGDQQDVAGHNLGNLILTALTQQCGSFFEAVQRAGKVLNVKGKIIPATTQVISLYAIMEDDVVVQGEANIPDKENHIRRVFYDEVVTATPEAVRRRTTVKSTSISASVKMAEGSSRMRIFALPARALAIETCCCSAMDRSPTVAVA